VPLNGSAQCQPMILIVEDDEGVRKLIEAVLAKLGQRVLSASNGQTALELAKSQCDAVDLLVADVGLPRLNGYDLAQRLRPEHPGMEVLYISGYVEGDLVERCRFDPGSHFLPKPFSPACLMGIVHEVLYGCAPPQSKAA
jgi:two-component system cell cycle sensor histidine kinase/response regulator CckA